MKCINRIEFFGIAAAALAALLFSSSPAAAKLKVVTTTPDLASITEAIGGDRVEVSSIATGYQDPHFVEAKPSYMMKAHRADLFIRVGLELEIGWEPLILDGSRNADIRLGTRGHLDVSEGVIRFEIPSTQKVDRSMGDIHPLGNPHYWTDPFNGRIIARNIAARLALLDPEHKDLYEANCSDYVRRIDEMSFGEDLVEAVGGERLWALEIAGRLDDFLADKGLEIGGWFGTMRPQRETKIVTYHRSWSYVANRFGLVVAEELEPKPGIPPSPGHLVEVIKRMKMDKVKVLVMEPFFSRRAPDLVSQKTGATVLTIANSVGGQEEAPDYIAMIDNIVTRISAGLTTVN